MKKFVLLSLLFAVSITFIHAQILDDLKNDEKVLKDNIIQVQYQKKSAQKAMLYSAVFPGAGQFYVNKKSVLTYIFPVIEVALWTSYIHNYSKGNDITNDYEKYANTFYSRDKQSKAENNLIAKYPNDIYTDDHFRLDATNTQHFYEDIGKYNKYIFGWDDWYATYVRELDASNIECNWVFTGTDTGNQSDIVWIGNRPINPPAGYDPNAYDSPGNSSSRRQKYINMREDAEVYYSNADNLRFLLVANHMISAIDAIRTAKKYNRNYIKTASIEPTFSDVIFNNQLTPLLNLSYKF
ncbi:MAG TPA: DUF5683 domain-containing protein [Candidatus Cloacimonadota bacterium]|nr:DUF5683 domain-containing protein [Candidatus Cloacimonadota bacterium]